MRISYSGLSTYEDCPLAYKFAKVERRPEITSPEARRGSEVHDCIAEYVKHLVETGQKTDLDFIRNLGISQEAREILETFASTHLFEPTIGKVLVEWSHTIQMDGFEWTGVVDLVEESSLHRVTITDYKTFWRALSQAEVEDHLQLRGYALLAADRFPKIPEFTCQMDFVRLGVTRQVTYLRQDLREIREDITRRVRQVETDTEYKPRPGARCDWCLGKADCPALKTGIEVITSQEDAEALADELIVLRARDKEIQALLRPHCTREGPISRNGMVVGYSTTHSSGYKTSELIHVLDDHDLDPMVYLQPATTELKKAAKKDPALSADLAEIGLDNSSSKFGIKKGEAA